MLIELYQRRMKRILNPLNSYALLWLFSCISCNIISPTITTLLIDIPSYFKNLLNYKKLTISRPVSVVCLREEKYKKLHGNSEKTKQSHELLITNESCSYLSYHLLLCFTKTSLLFEAIDEGVNAVTANCND